MPTAPQPLVADLSGYPDLTVICLGLRVTRLRGIATLLGLGPQIAAAMRARPDGLLHEESFLWRIDHVGIRQYWRDFDALERWARSEPHRGWWRAFSRDAKGTGFWHETYRNDGGVEGIYLGMKGPVGLGHFAPLRPREGAFATARRRSELARAAPAGARA